jgi:hypothetical protein
LQQIQTKCTPGCQQESQADALPYPWHKPGGNGSTRTSEKWKERHTKNFAFLALESFRRLSNKTVSIHTLHQHKRRIGSRVPVDTKSCSCNKLNLIQYIKSVAAGKASSKNRKHILTTTILRLLRTVHSRGGGSNAGDACAKQERINAPRRSYGTKHCTCLSIDPVSVAMLARSTPRGPCRASTASLCLGTQGLRRRRRSIG